MQRAYDLALPSAVPAGAMLKADRFALEDARMRRYREIVARDRLHSKPALPIRLTTAGVEPDSATRKRRPTRTSGSFRNPRDSVGASAPANNIGLDPLVAPRRAYRRPSIKEDSCSIRAILSISACFIVSIHQARSDPFKLSFSELPLWPRGRSAFL